MENTSGYSRKEGARIDALVLEAVDLFRSWGKKEEESGLVADAALVAVATFLGMGWRDREALERNLPRLTESFKRVMRDTFDKYGHKG